MSFRSILVAENVTIRSHATFPPVDTSLVDMLAVHVHIKSTTATGGDGISFKLDGSNDDGLKWFHVPADGMLGTLDGPTGFTPRPPKRSNVIDSSQAYYDSTNGVGAAHGWFRQFPASKARLRAVTETAGDEFTCDVRILGK